MTTEQEKAYEAWWSDPASPVNGTRREIFEAGWDAAERIAGEKYVEEGRFIANQVKAERTILRDKIMDKAVAAFRDGQDEAARLYRDLATELFFGNK